MMKEGENYKLIGADFPMSIGYLPSLVKALPPYAFWYLVVRLRISLVLGSTISDPLIN